MKAKTEILKQASYKLAEELYKNAAPQDSTQGGGDAGTAGPGGSGGADAAASGKAGSAEDVDYRVVDDEEKK